MLTLLHQSSRSDATLELIPTYYLLPLLELSCNIKPQMTFKACRGPVTQTGMITQSTVWH